MNGLQHLKRYLSGLHPMPEDEWEGFAAGLQHRRFQKGDLLASGGQRAHSIYFINKGATRHYFLQDGREFTVDFRFAGEMAAAYHSLITGEAGAVFITALEDTDTWAIPYTHLQSFYEKSKNGERIGRLIAENAYVQRLQREMELLSLTAGDRYRSLVARAPEIAARISVKDLSSYLGIQPESLSRIRRRYSKS